MNKAFCKKRVFLSFLLTGCLILFNLSCGLDTFYVIDAPHHNEHIPEWDNPDIATDSYFEFWTVDKDYDSVKFLGTDVYYKIYKSSSTMETQVNDLVKLATDSDTNTSAERMIRTYLYQSLRGQNHENENVLLPTTGSNQRVEIRLSDYTLYEAEISVDGAHIYGSSSRVIPVRNLENKPTFQFKSSNSDSIPKSSDADVNSNGSSTSDTEWYVAMFAVAVGLDYTYAQVFSNVLYLGSVTINVE